MTTSLSSQSILWNLLAKSTTSILHIIAQSYQLYDCGRKRMEVRVLSTLNLSAISSAFCTTAAGSCGIVCCETILSSQLASKNNIHRFLLPGRETMCGIIKQLAYRPWIRTIQQIILIHLCSLRIHLREGLNDNAQIGQSDGLLTPIFSPISLKQNP